METLNTANVEILTDLINDKTAGPLVLAELCSTLMKIRPDKKLMMGGSLQIDNPIFVNLQKRIQQYSKKPTIQVSNLVLRAIKVSFWFFDWILKFEIQLYFHLSGNPTELATNMLFNLFRMSNKLLSEGSPQHKRDSLILTLSAAGQTALHLGMFFHLFSDFLLVFYQSSC